MLGAQLLTSVTAAMEAGRIVILMECATLMFSWINQLELTAQVRPQESTQTCHSMSDKTSTRMLTPSLAIQRRSPKATSL